MSAAPLFVQPAEINLGWFHDKQLREPILFGSLVGDGEKRVDAGLLGRMIPCAVPDCVEIYAAPDGVVSVSRYVCRNHPHTVHGKKGETKWRKKSEQAGS